RKRSLAPSTRAVGDHAQSAAPAAVLRARNCRRPIVFFLLLVMTPSFSFHATEQLFEAGHALARRCLGGTGAAPVRLERQHATIVVPLQSPELPQPVDEGC